ncbi:acetylornithine transaminase [Brachybacterium vulturis]|uniref:acetylornithine transaminase n=1 Tax=Brachybacterium vulturis TaxID=2017484 RepID=UPI0037351656
MSEQTIPSEGTSGDYAGRYGRALLPVFGTPQKVLARGEGVHVWDTEGTRYLDLLAGIAVNALGHAHPALLSAVTKQMGTLGHVSNFFASAPQIELAEKLLELAEAPAGSGVFFANSGSEANEAAFKIARRTGRPRILALTSSFHGRTMGALALTAKEAYRTPFEPLPGGVEFLEPGDEQALADALAPGDVAAVFAEPIQGEAGVRPLSAEYLRALRRLTREHGTLLILDEVQTGVGRTGRWFAHQAIEGLQPDVMTLAKGLGGGFPIGAVISYGPQVHDLLQPGQHGTTFGGNPLASAAGLAVLGTILEDELLGHVRSVGAQLTREVLALEHPLIEGVRGAGLLLGIALRAPIAKQLAAAALAAGFIVNAPDESTLRLAPPLIITDQQLATFTAALPGLLDGVSESGATTTASTPKGER